MDINTVLRQISKKNRLNNNYSANSRFGFGDTTKVRSGSCKDTYTNMTNTNTYFFHPQAVKDAEPLYCGVYT